MFFKLHFMCGLGVSLHVSPLRESSLFPAVLWISRILALLVSKARCLGLISPAQVPRLGLGVPEVGHQPFASRDKLCICETPPNCVSPHQVCIFWWEHISVSPFYIDLFILHHWRVVYLVLRLFFFRGEYLMYMRVCSVASVMYDSFICCIACKIPYHWATGEATVIPYVGANLMCPWEEVNSGSSYAAVLNLFCYLFVKTHLHSQI